MGQVNFKKYLGIISILAFLGILINSTTGLNLDTWITGLLFIFLGIALMLNGKIQLFFEYFKKGLNANDVNKVVTNIIGLASFITGISIILQLTYPIIDSTKSIIALLAIIIIAADIYKDKNTCK